MITLYSKPSREQCDATKRALQARGIAYREVDLDADFCARAYVESLGYRQVPMVEVGPDHSWCGFRPELIAALPPGSGT